MCTSKDDISEWRQFLTKNYFEKKHEVWDPERFDTNLNLFHSNYVDSLSSFAYSCDRLMYVASIGACDGTSDKLLDYFYRSKHWRAVLVEANTANVIALNTLLETKNVNSNSLIVSGAIMAVCENSTVMLRTPNADPNDPSLPHWLRRQAGSIPTPEEFQKNLKHKKVWTMTEVSLPCVLAEWLKSQVIYYLGTVLPS